MTQHQHQHGQHQHGQDHDGNQEAGHDVEQLTDHEYWNGRYASAEGGHFWSGSANEVLARETADLSPGTALDLGCGEGGDAIHLARLGWRVTAVDVSDVALGRAADHAAEAGVADRIEWQRHDLAETFPTGAFDLVSTHFLHFRDGTLSPHVLRAAAAAVAPGGTLLIEAHGGLPPWQDEISDVHFPTPEETVDSLELAPGEWEVLLAERHPRRQTNPHTGEAVTRTDQTVKARRRPLV
ncbi:Methyltransferase domain-containing protein [Streptomyces zhaozhouensis]|uniref:Methyltransferase domain-containing protein n=1 Tax=Streptomyces zhaozhouensis TaxID=1300267 RepID=A0A286DY75_9ACTN|nr:class I SAM-dependent methyltransferase [Streptomyces zhaozhouensis]SOD63593.1 Methyltransferase domain-containing protein [Streptomyces zhaozhouensis]